MNRLTPEKRFDKNGRLVTRHVRVNDDNKKTLAAPTLASTGNNSHHMTSEIDTLLDLAFPIEGDTVLNVYGEEVMDPTIREVYAMVLRNCPQEVTASLFNAAQKYNTPADEAIIATVVYRIKNTTGTRKLVAKMMATHVETLLEVREDTVDRGLMERYESTIHDAMTNRPFGTDMDLDMQVDAKIIVSSVLPDEVTHSASFLQEVLDHRGLIMKHKDRVRERGFIDFGLLAEMDRTSKAIGSGAL